MADPIEIRAGEPGDLASLEALYPAAFPDEDLLPVLRALLGAPDVARSFVATEQGEVVGHVIFTRCGVGDAPDVAALLGPLAVAPDHQRKGIGSALVRAGLQSFEGSDVDVVLVLGDPAYYGRFGFEPEAAITPPYELPAEWEGAWRSLRLEKDAPVLSGTLVVPEPWRRPKLWTT